MILISGGAGFIGSNFVLDWLAQSDEPETLTHLELVVNTVNMEEASSSRKLRKPTFPLQL